MLVPLKLKIISPEESGDLFLLELKEKNGSRNLYLPIDYKDFLFLTVLLNEADIKGNTMMQFIEELTYSLGWSFSKIIIDDYDYKKGIFITSIYLTQGTQVKILKTSSVEPFYIYAKFKLPLFAREGVFAKFSAIYENKRSLSQRIEEIDPLEFGKYYLK